ERHAGKPPTVSRALPIVLAAAWAFLLSAVFQWPGVVLSSDGWAYWEGSVSLLAGEGYRWFGGQPIHLWPPGFSLYLAPWQALAGPRAGVLALSQAAAFAVSAALWAAIFLRPLRGAEPHRMLAPGVAIAVASVLALNQRQVGSESLAMALLAAALLLALDGPSVARGGRAATLLALSAALLLTRSAAVAFLPALLAARAIRADAAGRRRELAATGGVLFVAFLVWATVRSVLGQSGSHPLLLPSPAALGEVGLGMARQLADLAGPRSLGAGWILFVAHLALAVALAVAARGTGKREEGANAALALAGFTGVALVALWGLVPAASPLENAFGRFALFAGPALVLVPAWAATLARSRVLRRVAWGLLAATVAIQCGRAAFWARHSLVADRQGIAWSTCLDPGAGRSGGGNATKCAAPPDFPWIDRGYAARRP
ncbi:MAG TPA: hypothetical protein VMS76_05480, partial [Planctomycetota bacterium]|nr:hypothetical protein [Planctomycetota bacterium]